MRGSLRSCEEHVAEGDVWGTVAVSEVHVGSWLESGTLRLCQSVPGSPCLPALTPPQMTAFNANNHPTHPTHCIRRQAICQPHHNTCQKQTSKAEHTRGFTLPPYSPYLPQLISNLHSKYCRPFRPFRSLFYK